MNRRPRTFRLFVGTRLRTPSGRKVGGRVFTGEMHGRKLRSRTLSIDPCSNLSTRAVLIFVCRRHKCLKDKAQRREKIKRGRLIFQRWSEVPALDAAGVPHEVIDHPLMHARVCERGAKPLAGRVEREVRPVAVGDRDASSLGVEVKRPAVGDAGEDVLCANRVRKCDFAVIPKHRHQLRRQGQHRAAAVLLCGRPPDQVRDRIIQPEIRPEQSARLARAQSREEEHREVGQPRARPAVYTLHRGGHGQQRSCFLRRCGTSTHARIFDLLALHRQHRIGREVATLCGPSSEATPRRGIAPHGGTLPPAGLRLGQQPILDGGASHVRRLGPPGHARLRYQRVTPLAQRVGRLSAGAQILDVQVDELGELLAGED